MSTYSTGITDTGPSISLALPIHDLRFTCATLDDDNNIIQDKWCDMKCTLSLPVVGTDKQVYICFVCVREGEGIYGEYLHIKPQTLYFSLSLPSSSSYTSSLLLIYYTHTLSRTYPLIHKHLYPHHTTLTNFFTHTLTIYNR